MKELIEVVALLLLISFIIGLMFLFKGDPSVFDVLRLKLMALSCK